MSDAQHRRRGSRYRARRRAVALLFEAEMRDLDPVELAEERRSMGQASQEFHDVAPYTVEIVTGVAERLDRVDQMISDQLRGWTLERLPAVERAILRTGVWELLHGPSDVQPAVVIDQAVLLTSDLASPASVAYVNGVLDSISALAQHIRAAEAAVAGGARQAAADPVTGTDAAAARDETEGGTQGETETTPPAPDRAPGD